MRPKPSDIPADLMARATVLGINLPAPAGAKGGKSAPGKSLALLPDGPPGEWTVEIPGWRPTLASELIGIDKDHAASLKRKDAATIGKACLCAGATRAKGPRRVAFLLCSKGRPIDPDAVLKSGLDSLKTAGVILDDSAKLCEWSRPEWQWGPRRTVIAIADIA